MMPRHLCVITAGFGSLPAAVLVCASLGTSFAQQEGKPPAPREEPGAEQRPVGPYDPDPKHLWNRLH
jgi:hypothetical protein